MEIIVYAAIALAIAALAYALTHLSLSGLLAKFEGKSSAAPVTVNVGTAPGPTPVPAPVIVQAAVDHGATPPANAGSTGVQVGQPVPGGDVPDAIGAIAIPAIASKFPAGVRFLTIAALPFVPAGSAQAFCIAANCGNVKFLEGAFVNIPDFTNYKPLAAVANPASAVAVGGAAFHLQGQAAGEARTLLANCIAISSDLTTMDEVLAYCAKLPVYGSNFVAAPVAVK